MVNLNKIISLLPAAIQQAWSPFCEPVNLKLGQILAEPGRAQSHLYFPLTAIVSWVHVLQNGASTEVTVIGPEGVVGMHLLMGAVQTPNRAIAQKSGSVLRIPLSVVLPSFNQDNDVQKVFLRYAQTLITQVSQSSVCHQHHSLEQQFCRMLLLTLDRQNSNTIVMTHELLASLLGVRREGVTQAAHRLMGEKILHYSRGNITVLDRAALETRACECYGVISREYDRFLNALV
jgi:CRP-like cAMP-binding protein